MKILYGVILLFSLLLIASGEREEAWRMLNDLHAAGSESGLNINMSKTKCMRNEYSDRNPVLLQGVTLEEVYDMSILTVY
ncbi:hypothetical protein TELCIR_06490 [Teladorsagia circumcincta]|uniref:Reverse transcriptase domain-containing protein n=1 Tax=Teladorsagia circumcincta TaxID=45464 RepID=A0A2G9UMW8_TELCI|nr:hypothetical protein TELCIR_06490 [Teladorsagia circumcincta]